MSKNVLLALYSAPLNGAPLYNTPLYIAHHDGDVSEWWGKRPSPQTHTLVDNQTVRRAIPCEVAAMVRFPGTVTENRACGPVGTDSVKKCLIDTI